MKGSRNSKVKPISPEKLSEGVFRKPKKNSVGFGAIASSVNHIRKYMNARDAVRLSLKMNQKEGFDCPGCAWPDPDDDRSSIGEYCENGIKAIAEEATKFRLEADFFKQFSVAEISELTDFELGKLGRLCEPMILRKGSDHYEPIDWEAALSIIASHLKNLDSPDEAIFYTSGRTSNEAAYMYQLFVRAYGTNNLPDCSNMCHESSGVGLSETLGIGKGSVTLEDIHQADVILVMGQNPGTNHPRMLNALEKCKENGGKIVSVNPLPEAGLMQYTNPQSPLKMLTGGTALSDIFLPVRINGDVAFLKALMMQLYHREQQVPGSVFDHHFIEEHTMHFHALLENLHSLDYNECVRESGLNSRQIEAVADLLEGTQKIIVCWAMGLTQHENGVDNIKEIVNLLLMKGAIGIPGAGTCPVRGHSNVQGDRTMGIWEAPKDSFLDALNREHKIHSPRNHGYATVEAIEAMHKGAAKVFFAMGGNFLCATPDTYYTAEALQRCQLTVQVSTKLNRSHLIHGEEALILPCLGRTDIDLQKSGEQFVSCENSMGIVHSSRGILEPSSPSLKSEVAIVCELAEQTIPDSTINWSAFKDDYNSIRLAIDHVIPGFEDYNERILQPEGFYLPNCARDRKFETPDGKAYFSIVPLAKDKREDGEYAMMTIRSHDQFNTTIYGMNDRYRGIKNERRVILMNETDILKEGFEAGDIVNLSSHFNGVRREAKIFRVVSYPIPKGNVATYFPETNPLVPIDSFARGSKTPCSKLVMIRISKNPG